MWERNLKLRQCAKTKRVQCWIESWGIPSTMKILRIKRKVWTRTTDTSSVISLKMTRKGKRWVDPIWLSIFRRRVSKA